MKRLQVQNSRSLEGDFIWKTVDQYFSTYWSGLDARIYANKVLLDEIITLQFSTQEPVMPLYGYHSYTYESTVRGARRIQGAFTINFKRESYIFDLLNTLTKDKRLPKDVAKSFRETQAFRSALEGTATLETFLGLATGSSAKKDAQGRTTVDPELVVKAAQDFERAIWGIQRNTHGATSVKGVSQSEMSRLQFNSPKFGTPDGFDINIQFGSVDPKKLPRQTYTGQTLDPDQKINVAVATTKRILGVEIVGIDIMVDDSGRPVLEQYSFIAREID